MRGAALAVHIADWNFDDRSAVPRRQRWDEPVQFSVERHLLDDFATISLEGSAKVVDIHAAQFRHQPVRDARRNAPQPKVVDAVLAPAADDVVALADLLNEHRNIGRIMLEVAIHGDDVFAAGVVESSGEAGGLSKITAEFHDGHPAVDSCDLAQQLERAIGRTVVHQDDLEALAVRFHDGFKAVIEVGDILLLVMQRDHNRILCHGRFYYTGKGWESGFPSIP